MEPLSNLPAVCEGVVVPLDAGWSDVGSWDALWQISDKDDEGNVARGRVCFEQASSTFAHSEGRLIACVGTQNLVVVETPDAILVADRAHVQDVKKIVGRLKAESGTEASEHRKVHRPWGHYDSVDSGERFQVKRIVVKPGARLSLQMHHHRAEHWIVVRGTARITRGDETFLLFRERVDLHSARRVASARESRQDAARADRKCNRARISEKTTSSASKTTMVDTDETAAPKRPRGPRASVPRGSARRRAQPTR